MIVYISGPCRKHSKVITHNNERTNQIRGPPLENADCLRLTIFVFLYFSDHTEENCLKMRQDIFIKPCLRLRYDELMTSTFWMFNIVKVPYLIFDSSFRV